MASDEPKPGHFEFAVNQSVFPNAVPSNGVGFGSLVVPIIGQPGSFPPAFGPIAAIAPPVAPPQGLPLPNNDNNNGGGSGSGGDGIKSPCSLLFGANAALLPRQGPLPYSQTFFTFPNNQINSGVGFPTTLPQGVFTFPNMNQINPGVGRFNFPFTITLASTAVPSHQGSEANAVSNELIKLWLSRFEKANNLIVTGHGNIEAAEAEWSEEYEDDLESVVSKEAKAVDERSAIKLAAQIQSSASKLQLVHEMNYTELEKERIKAKGAMEVAQEQTRMEEVKLRVAESVERKETIGVLVSALLEATTNGKRTRSNEIDNAASNGASNAASNGADTDDTEPAKKRSRTMD